jgi:glycosyltransferase involved in cell wall biosynthesis
MEKDLQISVFLPAYNEESNIQKTILDVEKVLKALTDTYEILVINDGSKDKTGEVVKMLSKNNKKIRLVNHARNRGYGAAIKSGLYAVRYPWVVQMDSDGQFDFAQITKFLAKKNKADLVVGYRLHRTDSPYRRFMARILWLADFILFGLNVRDVDCGFKLFKKRVIEIIPHLKTESAITITEFITRAKKAGFKIEQVGVNHYARKTGEQTGGKPSIIFKAAWQGILLWFFLLKEKIWK